jgi:hypothetical protein
MIEPIDQKLRRISGLYSRIGSVGYLQRYRYRVLNQKTKINMYYTFAVLKLKLNLKITIHRLLQMAKLFPSLLQFVNSCVESIYKIQKTNTYESFAICNSTAIVLVNSTLTCQNRLEQPQSIVDARKYRLGFSEKNKYIGYSKLGMYNFSYL